MNVPVTTFADLDTLAADLRTKLAAKKYLLLFAYNGTGKTRLSMAFKEAGKQDDTRDTLYFNAFTEDLFVWDNDLEHDNQRVLRLNTQSSFFEGLEELEMDNRIRPFLQPLADFDFRIDSANWTISFFRNIQISKEDGSVENAVAEDIKISRGEERIFVWCFFLAIAQLAMDAQDGQAYDWVRYLYIDDPISSLDDNNAIAVASRLAQMLKDQNRIKTVISSHHTLFFNVLSNELLRGGNKPQYFLHRSEDAGSYALRDTGATPQFYHVAMLKDLKQLADSGRLFTYHFNILRNLLEKTATFHGFNNFSACLRQDPDDDEGRLHTRLVNLLNHGNYSLFEPVEMLDENKQHFRNILRKFMEDYRFNPDLFPEDAPEGQT